MRQQGWQRYREVEKGAPTWKYCEGKMESEVAELGHDR